MHNPDVSIRLSKHEGPTRGNQQKLYNYQLLNVLPCNMRCCSPEVGMLTEASAEGNIPTKGSREHPSCDMSNMLIF